MKFNFEKKMNKVFIKTIEIGIKKKFPHWNSTNIGVLGTAIADLLIKRLNYELNSVQHDDENAEEILKKLMKLSFLFLTRRLEVSSSNAHEIFKTRAQLLQNYGAVLHGRQTECKDEIISDHFYSSLAYKEKRFEEDARAEMELAQLLFLKYDPKQSNKIIEDDFQKVINDGMIKNYNLYNDLLKEYEENRLNIEEVEFEECFWNNPDLSSV